LPNPRRKWCQLKRHFPTLNDKEISDLASKQSYPYSFCRGPECFKLERLPNKKAFFNVLTVKDITDDDYNHAQNVFNMFKMKNFGNYHDLYLLTDILLLSDVLDSYRMHNLEIFSLDLFQYVSGPSFAFDAFLKLTKVTISLITDLSIFLVFEKALRGGVSTINTRYAKANNPHLKDYDINIPKSYITYWDANAQYPYAMSMKVPKSSFRFLQDHEIDSFDINNIDVDGDLGWVVECDLHIPDSLHDYFNNFPPIATHYKPSFDELSESNKSYIKKTGFSYRPTQKLIPNLYDKKEYVTHIKNLKFYLSLGVQLKKVHRIIQFYQEDFIKSFMDLCTKNRREAKTDIEKMAAKTLMNSLYGKFLENKRLRKDFNVECDPKSILKLISKPNFSSFKHLNDHTVIIESKKNSLLLDFPVFIGFTVLEFAKINTLDFYYNFFIKIFPNSFALMSDTDSVSFLTYTNQDLYEVISKYNNILDLSGYPKETKMYSGIMKSIRGAFKDEFAPLFPQVPSEYVGLRSKLYSFLLSNFEEKSTCKGVKKVIAEDELNFSKYKNCYTKKESCEVVIPKIQSFDNQLYTIRLQKLALSCFDDKRYELNDNSGHTLAYGHYKLRENTGKEKL
jgi:uncharacterized protein YeeX (DUF496 family)